MVFKQGVLYEEKIKFLIAIISVSIPYIAIAIISLIFQEDLKYLMTFISIFFLPLFCLVLLLGSINLEWFYVYEDRIEARYIFGIKNVVYFHNVLDVQQVKINLTARGWEKEFYIFNDGRKNNNGYFCSESCYNRKRFNLKIYKAPRVESYINDVLKFNVTQEI